MTEITTRIYWCGAKRSQNLLVTMATTRWKGNNNRKKIYKRKIASRIPRRRSCLTSKCLPDRFLKFAMEHAKYLQLPPRSEWGYLEIVITRSPPSLVWIMLLTLKTSGSTALYNFLTKSANETYFNTTLCCRRQWFQNCHGKHEWLRFLVIVNNFGKGPRWVNNNSLYLWFLLGNAVSSFK